jgi:hypothetical protein
MGFASPDERRCELTKSVINGHLLPRKYLISKSHIFNLQVQ